MRGSSRGTPAPRDPPAHRDPTDIGANVRRRRLALGLTLDQLAAQSGVSPTMLSEVERSVKNPTVRLAWQIARALGCSLTDLLEDDGQLPPHVIRATERRSLVDPDSAVERHALSPEFLRRGLELVAYHLPPGSTAGEMAPNRAGVVEHAYVTSGRLTLVLGADVHTLARGDGITYGPQTTVEYRNDGRSACDFVLLSDSTRAL
ncbi:MAG: helix-turn-helix domain-containing protein [Planctomycetes bacterium]|nr:helix-turn-helix domain-containing protein [Planctomycetota bacterium]